VSSVALDELVARIDRAFGVELPFSSVTLSENDIETLNRVFADGGYQRYLQDQVNRQIIRDYLTNAVVLNLIDDHRIAALTRRIGTAEGRSELSLHMLMTSVEHADALPTGVDSEPLKALQGESAGRHLSLVCNKSSMESGSGR
jgi:hypothetical protein